MADQLLTLRDVAALARVQRPVVSTWRRRPRIRGQEIPFPAPVQPEARELRFRREEVVAWLEASGRGNNPEHRQDAPAHAAPSGIHLEDVVALLCLHRMSGAEFGDLAPADLYALAESADPDDCLLLREIRALGSGDGQALAALLRYADELIEASYGTPDALVRLESGRLRRETGERGFADDLVELVRAVAGAARGHCGEGVALGPPDDPARAMRLADGFAALVLAGDSDSTRALRRRAVVAGVDLAEGAPSTVRVVSVVGGDERVALEAVHELVLSLRPLDVGIAIGSAGVLCDPLVGEAERLRADTIRDGSLAVAMRLGRGQWKAAHRQGLGLWVLCGAKRARTFWQADLANASLDLEDLASDVAAALSDSAGRAFRYLRRGELAPVLAGGPVVAHGVQARHLVAGERTALDAVRAASLVTSEPLRGYDVSVAPALGHALLQWSSVDELIRSRRMLTRHGNRIDPTHADPAGAVPVLSADGSTVAIRLDAFESARLYPRASRTEPGDVIVADRPRPAARVDAVGGALVATPSRILRLLPGAQIGPYALAAVVNALPATAGEWRGWTLPALPAHMRDPLEHTLAAAAAHRDELRRHEEALHELVAHLIRGVAAGTVDIVATEQRAG